MQIIYDKNKRVPSITYTKFLGLIIDKTVTWKNHTALLINKLSTAYYVIQSVKLCMSQPTLINILGKHTSSFSYDTQHHILRKFYSQFKKCSRYKRRPSEL